jgi:putative phosphoesterase
VARILVLSDTHIRRDGRRRLPDAVYRELERVDRVLHAGDLLVPEVLEELQRFTPVTAVLGNNDVGFGDELPEEVVIDVDEVRIGMVHDSGPKGGRETRMRRRFPDADVVVFGHSHIPWHTEGVDGPVLFNPGSPTERRAQPRCTYGLLQIDGGALVDARIVPV